MTKDAAVPIGEVPCGMGDEGNQCGEPSTHAIEVRFPTGRGPANTGYLLVCAEHARQVNYQKREFTTD